MGKVYWVDPPSGWKYGFPKLYESQEDIDMYNWLVEQGYPQSEIDKMGKYFFTRQWAPTEEEIEEYINGKS